MKKVWGVPMLMGIALLAATGGARAQDPISEIIKQVIMSIDLGIQKVQTQTIYLQDAQKVVENTMQQLHLTDITDWVQRQEDLYAVYYQELWKVKNAILFYQRVKNMIDKQIRLVQDYQKAYGLVGQDKHFSPGEVGHIYSVYDGILKQSIQNIGQIELVINAFVTQMADADRLRIIDEADNRIDRNYSDLKQFTQENILRSIQRSQGQNDLNVVKSLYGIQ